MNNRNPVVGETLGLSFSEDDVREAVVLMHTEDVVPGACDLSTEFMMVDIAGSGVHSLTRHSIKPDTDQEWCITTMDDAMVEVFPLEPLNDHQAPLCRA